MAKQRVVNTKFWDDTYISTLAPLEKLMFLYVLTNPLTDLCGAYEITMKRIISDTGIRSQKALEILAEFEKSGKVIYRDGWMIVRNFAKHQVQNPKVSKGVERSLNACPDWIKQTLSIGYDSLSKPIALLPVGTTCRDNPNLKGEPVPELKAWLDAVASVTGAKSGNTLAEPHKWRDVCLKAMHEGRGIDQLLAVIKSELKRNKDTPQFFSPNTVLKQLQLGSVNDGGSTPNRPTGRELAAQVAAEEAALIG